MSELERTEEDSKGTIVAEDLVRRVIMDDFSKDELKNLSFEKLMTHIDSAHKSVKIDVDLYRQQMTEEFKKVRMEASEADIERVLSSRQTLLKESQMT